MALVTTVAPATIAVVLGQAAPASGSVTEERYSMWIDDALMLIQIRLDDSADPTLAIDQTRLDYVIREAVAAHARRPDDSTQVSVATDDSSVSKTYKTGKGRVSILDEWWALLGLATSSGSGAFSVRPYGSSLSGHAPWCSLHFGGAVCSCGYSLAGWAMYEPGEF